jgi:NADPH-dependent 2,4-dienoyl-CoA reductase/sulfur reductase-like enzyme/rhodanese-related sulfurtransferase
MKIVVVGGVAAGASAAARARRLSEDAEILVLERGSHVSFANCGLPYHIGEVIEDREELLLQTPESLQANLNIEVRTGHEATAIHPNRHEVEVFDRADGKSYTESFDKLILAPGARPIRPPLPGIDHPRIFTLRDVDDMDQIKAVVDADIKNAVVVGGGYIGVEMAENLVERGIEVDLVELQDQIMAPLDPEMARPLQYHMQWKGVRLHLNTGARAFSDDHGRVRISLEPGGEISTDLVILAVGVRPESELARKAGLMIGPRGGIVVDRHMRTSHPDVYAAGDVVEVLNTVTGLPALVPLAGPANRQGRIAANHIFGKPGAYEATQGTAIVKLFDMTGGSTGANEKALRASKTPYRKVYVHPSGHASYYPGTAPLHMKVVFSPDSGALYGAQVVGFDGIDKRIDVLATAIQAGMSIFDLQNLELAYAPPFGSAKDPVNMAGFVGANLLQGDIRLWYAEEFEEAKAKGVILDVRSADEYGEFHLPDAINIPLPKLRERNSELPIDRPVYVYCRVGFRSYLAFRILHQLGFDAYTLSGGTFTFCHVHGSEMCSGEPLPPVVSYAENARPGFGG